MKQLAEIVSTTYRMIFPKPWPNWAPKTAKSQKLSNYISFHELFEWLYGTVEFNSHLNSDLIASTLENGRKRKAKLVSLKNRIEISRLIFLGSISSFVVFLVLDYLFPKTDLKWWTMGFLLLSAVFGIPTGIWLRELRATIRNKIEPTSTYPFLESNSSMLPMINITNKDLRKSEITPFILEADNEIKSLSVQFWKADCFELGLFGSHEMREAVSLEGETPSGLMHFLKSDIERIFEKPLITEKGQKVPKFTLSIFSDPVELESTIEFIRQNCDKTTMVNKFKLTDNREAWTKALDVLLGNFDTYELYKSGELTLSEQREFLSTFYPVFASISKGAHVKGSKTDADLGHSGTIKFLRGKNQNLHYWLESLRGSKK